LPIWIALRPRNKSAIGNRKSAK